MTPGSLGAHSQVVLLHGCQHDEQSRTVKAVFLVASSCSELNVRHLQSNPVPEAICKDARTTTDGCLTQRGANPARHQGRKSASKLSLPYPSPLMPGITEKSSIARLGSMIRDPKMLASSPCMVCICQTLTWTCSQRFAAFKQGLRATKVRESCLRLVR